MAATVWNAADKTASITLSGVNLIATGTAFAFAGLRATNPKLIASAVKVYYEITANASFTDNRSWDGFGSESMTLGAVKPPGGNYGSRNEDGTLVEVTGTGGVVTAFGAINSKTTGFAIDFAAKKFWVTDDGTTWNAGGTANPATGVGGATWTTGFGADLNFYIAATIIDNGAAFTLNAGNSAFAHTVPSGFSSWDTAVPVIPRSAATILC